MLLMRVIVASLLASIGASFCLLFSVSMALDTETLSNQPWIEPVIIFVAIGTFVFVFRKLHRQMKSRN